MQENTPEFDSPFDKYGPLAPLDPAKHVVVHNFASATEAAAAAFQGPRHAEPHEMACCFGDGLVMPRCIRPAKWIKRDEPFVGRAYCDEHPPLKRKGSWWVPVPLVRIER